MNSPMSRAHLVAINKARTAKATAEAEKLRDVVEQLIAQGKTKQREIAEALNELGHRTPQRLKWNSASIYRLLVRLNIKES